MIKDTEDETVSPFKALITTLAFVALGGLGILVGLIALLLNKGVAHEAVTIISMLYLGTLFGICFSLIRLMSKLIDTKLDKKTESLATYQTPQLSIPTNPQLNEYHQPLESVTEHTTRTFDEAFVKRN